MTDIIHRIEKSVDIDNFKDTKLLANTDDHLLSAISISQAVLFINYVIKKIMNIICKYFLMKDYMMMITTELVNAISWQAEFIWSLLKKIIFHFSQVVR